MRKNNHQLVWNMHFGTRPNEKISFIVSPYKVPDIRLVHVFFMQIFKSKCDLQMFHIIIIYPFYEKKKKWVLQPRYDNMLCTI